VKYFWIFLLLTFFTFGEEDMTSDLFSEYIQERLDEIFEIKLVFIKQIEVEFWDRYNDKHRKLKLNTYYFYDWTSNIEMIGIQYLGGIWFFNRTDYYNLLHGTDERKYNSYYYHIDGESVPGKISFSKWNNSFEIKKIDMNPDFSKKDLLVVFFEPTGNGVTLLQYEWLFTMKILDNFVR
jgi:hypothetical protein